jgi:hypothetical protein
MTSTSDRTRAAIRSGDVGSLSGLASTSGT